MFWRKWWSREWMSKSMVFDVWRLTCTLFGDIFLPAAR